MGWAGIKNGALLALAEKEFDAFITVDRKISIQQDLTKFKIPVLLLRARSNRLEDIRPLVPELLKTLDRASAGALMAPPIEGRLGGGICGPEGGGEIEN